MHTSKHLQAICVLLETKFLSATTFFSTTTLAFMLCTILKHFLRRKRVLPWPSLSPDLNPIENISGQLTCDVYAAGKQNESVEKLKVAVLGAWRRLTPQY